jgi:hypothetical protein
MVGRRSKPVPPSQSCLQEGIVCGRLSHLS